MVIYLYEEIIDDCGKRLHGRLAAEIKCKGDGTKGEIIFYNVCNEIRENKDRNHPAYGTKRQILDRSDKSLLEKLFNDPVFITSNAGIDADNVHYMGGKTLMPWETETIRYILDYRLSSWFGTVCGKIDDTSHHQKVPGNSPVAQVPVSRTSSVPQEKSRSKFVLAIAVGAIAGLLLLCCGASVIIPLLYYYLNF